jgi:multisubunit Na+/H+ antiporter MnhG subunit
MIAMVADALLAGLVGCALVAVLALLRLRAAPDALHALAFLGVACGVLLGLAVLVGEGIATVSFKALVLLAILLGGGAVSLHAIGRALDLGGDWDVEPRDVER